MPKKKEEKIGLTYKGKPLLRKEDKIYYGNPGDKYIILMTIRDYTEILDIKVSTNVLVELMTNAAPGKEKIIKKAERDGLYAAIDLAEFWLDESLEEGI